MCSAAPSLQEVGNAAAAAATTSLPGRWRSRGRPLLLGAPSHDWRVGGRRLLPLLSGTALLHPSLRVGRGLKPRGNQGDGYLPLGQLDCWVHHGAEDDQRRGIHKLVDDLRRFVHFVQGEVLRPRDVPHDTGRAVDAQVQQRGRDGGGSGFARAVFPSCATNAHERRTSVGHHSAHVRKVDVDETRQGDDIANSADALAEDVIREQERVLHGQRGIHGT
mmetsp:Transcript_2733/g.4361  ORF Transcript_2733/g.4361 Transcript_2733/m.4361 type:complete len:219 (+) Transcript_2733:2577-3233(+)